MSNAETIPSDRLKEAVELIKGIGTYGGDDFYTCRRAKQWLDWYQIVIEQSTPGSKWLLINWWHKSWRTMLSVEPPGFTWFSERAYLPQRHD